MVEGEVQAELSAPPEAKRLKSSQDFAVDQEKSMQGTCALLSINLQLHFLFFYSHQYCFVSTIECTGNLHYCFKTGMYMYMYTESLLTMGYFEWKDDL